jgi:hypothetical protein
MIINEKEYVLSPRKTKEVLDFQEAFKDEKLEDSANITNVLIMAQTISDSLKATWRNEVIKVFLKRTKLNPKFIIDNIDELGILYKRINIFTRWLIKRKVNRYRDYLVDWKYLLNVLDEKTFTEAFLFVSELEGNKKKVVVENQSVETLQKEK